MKVLLIDPAASTSTWDVYQGYRSALERAGHEVKTYNLNSRIDRAGAWLHWNWGRSRREGVAVEKPTAADIVYWAGTWAIEMALRLRPDWVVVFSGMYFLKDTQKLLRQATYPWSRLAVMLTESPYDDQSQAQVVPLYDAVFTNERRSVEYLRQFNPNTQYLPHAYDPERHRPDLPLVGEWPSHDVVFVGTGYPERIALLSAIDWSGIDLGLYGTWNLVGSRSKLRPFIHNTTTISNADAVQLYRRAKIGLNLHRTTVGFGRHNPKIESGAAESLNARAYELAACGVFTVSDYRAELADVFRTNRVVEIDGRPYNPAVVPSFGDGRTLENVIRYWLARPEERAAQGAGQQSAVAPHTYDARVQTLLGVLETQRAAA
jgi:spore maturation protein CgeB